MTFATTRISLQAIRYGHYLSRSLSEDQLRYRLYNFNRAPVSQNLLSIWPDSAAYLSWLFAGPNNRLANLLSAKWKRRETSDNYWSFYELRGSRDQFTSNRSTNGLYKIYVSPETSHIPAALETSIEAAAAHGCALLKFGINVHGATRPDKIIIYTDSWQQTEAVGNEILDSTTGIPPHGVPFTADLNGDGLVSWALDPRSDQFSYYRSWRRWITHIIAKLLLAHRDCCADEELISSIMTRLEVDYGIIPDTWALKPYAQASF